MRHQSFANAESSAGVAQRVSLQPDAAPRIGLPQAKGPMLFWVDDSRTLLSLYKSVFESMGFAVSTMSSPVAAIGDASLATADVAILDYDMPELNGATLARLIKARRPHLPVILYSGSNSIPQGTDLWVDAICAKAAPRQELVATIARFVPVQGKSRQPVHEFTRPRQITTGEFV